MLYTSFSPIQPVTTTASLSSQLGTVQIVDLREQTASGSTDGLSGYRHSRAGHDGEGEGEEVPHTARTAGGHNEPISELETFRQRPEAPRPTKTPSQRSNLSHESVLFSANHSDGLAFPTDTSMRFEVSKLNRRTVPLRLHLGVLPRQQRTLHQNHLRALICFVVPLSPNHTTKDQNIYVSSRTSLVHQGPTAATETYMGTTIAHTMKETEIIRRASSALTMKAVTADAQ